MKILHVESGRHLYGGAQQVAYIIEGMQARGHEQIVVCPEGAAIGEEARKLAIRSWPIGPNGDLDWRFIGRFRRQLESWRPDLVHLHSRRGADSVALIAARRAGLPVVLSRRVDNPEPRWLANWRYSRCDRVITISHGIAEVLRAAGVDESRIRVVHSTVPRKLGQEPFGRAVAREVLGLPGNALAVAIAAQLIKRKGHSVLFQALEKNRLELPSMRLLVFGRGPEEAALKAEAERRKIAPLVQFMGFREDLDQLWSAFDLLVHPALMEGLGVALLKAQAAGVPILATTAGGIPEAVENEETGILVPPGDVEVLGYALLKLLREKDLRQKLGRAGPAFIERHFSVDVMVNGNLEVYEEVLGEGSKL